MREIEMTDCRVCSTPDEAKPTIFRGEEWCSDGHRKIILGEVEPKQYDIDRMEPSLYKELTEKKAVLE
jgi:hypothetical protein